MAAAGDAAEKSFDETVAGGDFYWVVEGGIPTKIPGAMTVGGKTPQDIAKEIYPKAKATIAIGTCASYGNIQAAQPNPTGAMGVGAFLEEAGGIPDAVVINMSRCPGNAEDLIAALSYMLVTGKLPELDSVGRPKFLYGQTIHDSCFRRGEFEAGEFVETFGDEHCADELVPVQDRLQGPGHLRPVRHQRWNGHVSWCVHNAPCMGCAEPGFWDKLTPFYEQRPTSTRPASAGVSDATSPASLVGGDCGGIGAH